MGTPNANAVPGIEVNGSYPRVCIDHLLDIAAAQFAQYGQDGVSIRDIGRQAGLKAPSICYHFASKDNLYREAFAYKLEQTVDFVNTRILAVADRKQRFGALVEAFYDLFTGDRNVLVLMQRDVIDAGLRRRPLLCREQFSYFTALLRRLASDHADCDIDNETAFTISALIFGYCELYFVRIGGLEQGSSDWLQAGKKQLVRAASSLVLASVRNREPLRPNIDAA